MNKMLLYIWQLPQNLLGLLVIRFTGSIKVKDYYVALNRKRWGVSLGKYIIFGYYPNYVSIRHEQGHQKQSLYLGWLYLIIIGIPSFCGNIFDRLFHRKWDVSKRYDWYFSQPWEKWADDLGGVNR